MKTDNLAIAYGKFYEELTIESKREDYSLFFDENSTFKDPFQEVKGLEAIENVFIDMYKNLHNSKFIMDEIVSSDKVSYLRWKFEYSLKPTSKIQSFIGVSRVTFNKNGKVDSHIDYWNPAEHIYEKIPILGFILRIIKKKLSA